MPDLYTNFKECTSAPHGVLFAMPFETFILEIWSSIIKRITAFIILPSELKDVLKCLLF